MILLELAKEIIDGKRLTKDFDYEALIYGDLDSLCKGADLLRSHFSGDYVDMCTIINGRSGRCSEDCKYCAQSIHHNTNCQVYDFLDEDTILQAAHENEQEGVHRFSIVTSGRKLSGSEFQQALSAYIRLREECHISLCASHGFLTKEEFISLKNAGVERYHCNIETSRNYFPSICTTHSFDEKITNIRRAREAGLSVCCGGIIGMGESWQDRIDMALTLSELQIKSIPLNALMPIPGTPFENLQPLSKEDILRTVAIFRFINPEAHIRLAAGRALLSDNGQSAFQSGASAMITGNMLTTTSSTILNDKKMLSSLGRRI